MLSPEQAVDRARQLNEQGQAERKRLDDVRRYWTGRQRFPAILPTAAPAEVRVLARLSRVNIIDLVVESLAQSLAVEGFRAHLEAANAGAWDVWQANRMDARQAIIHRAVLAYGVAYAVVTPGEPEPVIRGLSPRRLTTLYDEAEPDWPTYALERRAVGPWRLYDETHVHLLKCDASDRFEYQESKEHGAGTTPVVRYLEVHDPDWDDEPTDESQHAMRDARDRQVIGVVADLMTIQDQIDLITFNLLVAQHFAAFRQRYIIGWAAPDEETKVKMGATSTWTFGDENVKVGSLDASPLDGYLDSREASFRQAASLSQTPAHELIGELVNLSAEALTAAEAGRDRKVDDRQKAIGEGHEQLLRLAARLGGKGAVPEGAQVVWRDTSARSFAATVDALGKLATMLGVPAMELWERIPGTTQQDIDRWKVALAAASPVDAERDPRVEDVAALIRAGFTPGSALASPRDPRFRPWAWRPSATRAGPP